MIDHDHVSGASFGQGYHATPEPVPVSALREGIPSASEQCTMGVGCDQYDRNCGSELGRDKGRRARTAIRNLKSETIP